MTRLRCVSTGDARSTQRVMQVVGDAVLEASGSPALSKAVRLLVAERLLAEGFVITKQTP